MANLPLGGRPFHVEGSPQLCLPRCPVVRAATGRADPWSVRHYVLSACRGSMRSVPASVRRPPTIRPAFRPKVLSAAPRLTPRSRQAHTFFRCRFQLMRNATYSLRPTPSGFSGCRTQSPNGLGSPAQSVFWPPWVEKVDHHAFGHTASPQIGGAFLSTALN